MIEAGDSCDPRSMMTWSKSILGGLVGATAVVALIWLMSLPQVLGWIKANDGVAAWAAIVLNGVGLWFIFRQLGLTQKAAESAQAGAIAARAATEIALAETRPWLKVELQDGATAKIGRNRDWLGANIRVFVENIGRTPATHVRFHWVLLTDTDDEILARLISDLPSNALQGSVIFPGETTGFGGTQRIALPIDAPANVQAFIMVAYSSPGGGQHVTPVLAVEIPWTLEEFNEGERPVELCVEVRSCLQPT
ncbi:MAG: hypothetical protein IE912_10940 [Brevundimonas diminuta]|nr:hypothetical protein [Brevundimonas diminuta]MBD3819395.1 hypothetical protein [Brevundimonas diminuta]